MPKFDWISEHDPASLGYGIREVVGNPVLRPRFWKPGDVLDQGEEGACVGHGFAAEALASPVRVKFPLIKLPEGWPNDPQAFAFHLYNYCRATDTFPGVDHEGTSVLAGAKAMKELGLIKEYRWAFGITDVLAALQKGPVVLGIPWLSGMYRAPGGVLTAHGNIVGGHCILAIGYSPDNQTVALLNSWGPDWGLNGVAWISVPALSALLRQRGEACIPTWRSYGLAA